MNNLCSFLVGAIVKSAYSGKVYKVLHHTKNGMCELLNYDSKCTEVFNAYNNKHFVPLDPIDIGILLLLN